MVIVVVGSGKLAQELMAFFLSQPGCQALTWQALGGQALAGAVVVHAGSGRELDEVIAHCSRTHTTLVELSTGSAVEGRTLNFPVVLCANTNILMLKVMAMLAGHGHLFQGYERRLTESHQTGKTSTPGTAVELAEAIGLREGDIVSVRDPAVQQDEMKIPAEHLGRHAFHRIVIEDGLSSVTLETRVLGPAPYAQGVAQIVAAIQAHPLEDRLYKVTELVDKGWL